MPWMVSNVINIEMSISVDVNDEPLCHGWYPRVINIEMSISVDVNDEPLCHGWYPRIIHIEMSIYLYTMDGIHV